MEVIYTITPDRLNTKTTTVEKFIGDAFTGRFAGDVPRGRAFARLVEIMTEQGVLNVDDLNYLLPDRALSEGYCAVKFATVPAVDQAALPADERKDDPSATMQANAHVSLPHPTHLATHNHEGNPRAAGDVVVFHPEELKDYFDVYAHQFGRPGGLVMSPQHLQEKIAKIDLTPPWMNPAAAPPTPVSVAEASSVSPKTETTTGVEGVPLQADPPPLSDVMRQPLPFSLQSERFPIASVIQQVAQPIPDGLPNVKRDKAHAYPGEDDTNVFRQAAELRDAADDLASAAAELIDSTEQVATKGYPSQGGEQRGNSLDIEWSRKRLINKLQKYNKVRSRQHSDNILLIGKAIAQDSKKGDKTPPLSEWAERAEKSADALVGVALETLPGDAMSQTEKTTTVPSSLLNDDMIADLKESAGDWTLVGVPRVLQDKHKSMKGRLTPDTLGGVDKAIIDTVLGGIFRTLGLTNTTFPAALWMHACAYLAKVRSRESLEEPNAAQRIIMNFGDLHVLLDRVDGLRVAQRASLESWRDARRQLAYFQETGKPLVDKTEAEIAVSVGVKPPQDFIATRAAIPDPWQLGLVLEALLEAIEAKHTDVSYYGATPWSNAIRELRGFYNSDNSNAARLAAIDATLKALGLFGVKRADESDEDKLDACEAVLVNFWRTGKAPMVQKTTPAEKSARKAPSDGTIIEVMRGILRAAVPDELALDRDSLLEIAKPVLLKYWASSPDDVPARSFTLNALLDAMYPDKAPFAIKNAAREDASNWLSAFHQFGLPLSARERA